MYPDQRQYDPDPIGGGWETAAAVTLLALAAAAFAALAGQGLAALLFGGGWVWPTGGRDEFVHSLGGVLAGHPGRGLSPADAAALPGSAAVYSVIVVVEVVTVALLVAGSIFWARYRRPRDARRGMATRAEAARTLGAAELRRAQALIRPDLDDPR